MPEPFDTKGFIRTMLGLGWHWSESDATLLIHPGDHDLCLRYDSQSDQLTVSPKLDEYLRLIIPTPRSKSRFWR
jgi:hypothetical protein